MPNRNVSVTSRAETPNLSDDEAPSAPCIPEMALIAQNRMVRQGFVRVRRKKKKPGVTHLRWPPTLRAEIKSMHTFRFTGTVAEETDITVKSLLTLVVAANSSSSVRPIFSSVRLVRIGIWTPVQSIGGAATFCALRYEGTNSDDTTHYDTSAVVDDMAHVYKPPPRQSLAGFWHHSDVADLSLKLAWVSLGPDSVMDITVEFVVDDTSTNSAYTFTGGSGQTTGTLYYGSIGSYTQPGKSQYNP